MGMVGLSESRQAAVEEFRRMLLSCTGTHRRKREPFEPKTVRDGDDESDAGDRLVCVTSGLSYLGLAIVNRLLVRGYYVRLVVTNEEDLDTLRELVASGDLRGAHDSTMVGAAVADFSDVASLMKAFGGCRGVFHTAALVDPSGLSGYSKSMCEIEVKGCENVMEACGRSSCVKKCVLTSSLLACIWGDHSASEIPSTIDHSSWSDESVCMHRKLWYALGKLKAEKVAWKVAEKRDFKLATICPGLVTGPQSCLVNSTASIAYLKGTREMFAKGLLASVDVNKLAEAHVCIHEEMNRSAFGRYICFDRVFQREEEVENLAEGIGMQLSLVSRSGLENSWCRFELSNTKLSKLMMTRTRCRNEHLKRSR